VLVSSAERERERKIKSTEKILGPTAEPR